MAPPKPLPLILFLALPLFFALGVGPLLGAVHDPQRNVGRWSVLVADLDGGIVGSSLLSALQGAAASGVGAFPTLDIQTASSPEELRAAVRDGRAWGAVWANAGATAALEAAIADPAGAAASYRPTGAATLAWDEGRSPLGPAARIIGPVKAAVGMWAARMAAQVVGGLNASSALPALAAVAPGVLTSPVGFTEESLFPAAQWPVFTTALTIGQILIAVFAMAIALATLGGLSPWYMAYAPAAHRTPGKLVAFQATAIVLYTMAVSATAATIALSLSALSSGHGVEWARVWAIFWAEQLSFAFWLATVAVVAGPGLVGPALFLMLVSNIIGGWNTVLAAPGYMAFSCTTMYSGGALLRNAVYGSESAAVGQSVGVLIMWIVVDASLFVGASLAKAGRAARAKAAAAAAAVEAKSAPAGEQPLEGGSVSPGGDPTAGAAAAV